MKLILKHIHHKPSTSLSILIERHLEELGKSLQIDEARVVIEHRTYSSPPFHISMHFATPGPDVFAEAMDHTLRAALQKTVDQLEIEIDQRRLKRTRRSRGAIRATASRKPTSAATRN